MHDHLRPALHGPRRQVLPDGQPGPGRPQVDVGLLGLRERLRERTTVIYLRSTPEELFRRLRHDTQRPLLQVRDPLRRLRDLYRERDPFYRETCHFTIETGRPSVPTLVNMILMQLELAGVIDPSLVPATIGRVLPP